MFPLITRPCRLVPLFKKRVINEVSRSAAVFVKAAQTPVPPFSSRTETLPHCPHSRSV